VITVEDLRTQTIFDCFDDARLAELSTQMADMILNAGEYLFFEGDPAAFYVLLEGSVELSHTVIRNKHVIAQYKASECFGEVPLLLGSKALSDCRALERVRVARIDQHLFRIFLSYSQTCKATLLKTLMDRVGRAGSLVEELPIPKITLIGDAHDRASSELRQFLTSVRTPYFWLDRTAQHERARSLLGEASDLPAVSAVYINDKLAAISPTLRELARLLELPTEPRHRDYDVVIVGAGPAGLAAAVYGASEGLSVLVIDQKAPGGQAGCSSRIENYLGFPGGISGDQLTERALRQANRFGAEVVITRRVTVLERSGKDWRLDLEEDAPVQAKAVILTIGVDWRRLEARNTERFIGHGVTYGADRSEAPFVAGKDIFIVGGGNSAGQAAMFFSSYAGQVTLLVRGDSLQKSMSQYLIDQLATKTNITVELETEVVGLIGQRCLETIVTQTRRAGTTVSRNAYALFVMIGATAHTEWLPSELARDKSGFLLTGRDLTRAQNWHLEREPMGLETSLPKVFAAGDVRHGSVKRVASGVGEGSTAISFVHQIL
jgi:thioredoxin reductase (NADPH)